MGLLNYIIKLTLFISYFNVAARQKKFKSHICLYVSLAHSSLEACYSNFSLGINRQDVTWELLGNAESGSAF